ncbi:LytR/AlgR family response regulator transcription factor [Mucilaginibacter pedocola]|uniref:DNA-binding response regulator n=1 Tax=Mucilaginibacter pedocola TaxID=1792845 RepID=A0A1S9PKX4_9SPHI|nr:LytTR family DNA-binding domain-containing protein [Mucilaginibacter pedocola]OOQ61188.1 DNA-binding response regulator [Mucilaginibacter pedocola]
MINCAIIDDEPLAREGLANYVREVDFLNLTGLCENPLELLPLLNEQNTDLIFLDIQMPKMNGIDFLKVLQRPPMVVITTAYPTFALEGFQLNVLDYLLKPITFERFFKAAAKARDYHQLVNADSPRATDNYFFIKCGTKYEKVVFEDILYIEGMQNYVTIYTIKGKYVTMLSLKNLEEKLPANAFIRVHKSFIAAVGKIDGIEGNEIFVSGSRIPISRSYRDMVLEKVVFKRLIDKR